jgi:CDP-diglyceride synthetase
MVVFAGIFIKAGETASLIISTVILTYLPELLSDYAKFRALIYSVILVLIMLYKDAAAGALSKLFGKSRSRMRKKDCDGA